MPTSKARGFRFDKVISVPGNTTIYDYDNIKYVRVTATATITLPAPGNNIGRVLVIERNVGSATVTIKFNSDSDTLDGLAYQVSGTSPLTLNNNEVITIRALAANVWITEDFCASNSVSELNTRRYLIDSDFPNTTTLYRWKAPTSDSATWTALTGGIDLTRTGILTTSSNHIGITSANTFDGSNDYLNSTSASLKLGNGAFVIGFWINPLSWTSGAGNILGSYTSSGGLEGIIIYKNASTIDVVTYNSASGVAVLSVDTTSFSGWTQIIYVRTSETNHKLYANGLLVRSSDVTGTIDTTENRYFEVCASNTVGSVIDKLNASIDEIFIHIGASSTQYTTEVIKKIYAAGSRRRAILCGDGTIDINLPLEGKWFNWIPTYAAEAGTFDSVTTTTATYCIIKNMVNHTVFATGTPSTTARYLSYSLPILAAREHWNFSGYIYDGTNSHAGLAFSNSTNYGSVARYDYNASAFTNGSNRQIKSTGFYQI